MAKIIIETEVEGLANWEDQIKEAMNRRIKFGKAKEKAEEGIVKANTDLGIIFNLLGIEEGLRTKNQGKFTFVAPGHGSSFNKKDCKALLATRGVDIDVITACFDEATKETDKVGYMKWDPKRAKKTEE